MVVQSRVLPAGNTFTGTPVVLDVRGDGTIDLAIATHGEDLSGGGIESLESWMLADGDADSLADSVPPGALARKASCPAVAGDSVIAIGTEGGMVTFFGASIGAGRTISTGDGDTSAIVGISLLETGGRFVVVSANGTVSIVDEPAVSSSVALRKACANPAVTGVISSSSSVIVLATLTGDVYLFDRNLNVVPGFPVATGDVILNAPALADIDGDGRRDIIVFSGNRIVALNASGAMVNNFPITLPTDSAIATSPVVADLQGDGKVEIIAVTREGLVCAYGHDRRIPDGFPLLTGPNSGSTPVVFYRTSPCLSCADIALAVASDDGHVYGWKTGSIVVGPAAPPAQPWPQYMYDAANSGRVLNPLLPVSRTSEFLPASLAYNWPNPVGPSDDNLTRIRFYLSADAAVSIKIFDLAGQLVEELQIQGKGGMDNEVMWHVADVGSGVYFARINAEGSGQSGSAVVKVAVVK
jgi:WD40 repeat protein